uniref:Cystatin domain-containing protein n=1 Tax=Elaeophora elaphi TaxID=1147741 RepID=A0A0R3RFH4_9BILA
MIFSIKDGLLVILLLLFGVVALLFLQGLTSMESKGHAPLGQQTLLGGWQERSPEDSEIQELLPSILMKVNQQSNDEYHLMPIKLLKVSSQVVAGVKYKMEVQVARSECKKGLSEEVNLKTCKRLEGHPDQVFTLEVWEKPWEDFLQVSILGTKVLSSV